MEEVRNDNKQNSVCKKVNDADSAISNPPKGSTGNVKMKNPNFWISKNEKRKTLK